ncbi:MAG: amidohydrolase family protein [Gemmatimonadota bacterium]|nr:amidohydrolase family protein [Gemmatimonadota bacterium]
MYSDVVELFKTSGTTNSPTLLVSYGRPFGENFFYATENAHDDETLNVFAPADYLDARTRRRGPGGGGSPGDAGWFLEEEHVFPRHAEFVKKMLEGDARVGVGSHGQLQGLGYHWELWAMAAGGASNYDILRSATILGAEAIGFGAQLGTIEQDKFADIVILNSNPLDDLRNTVDILYVMKDGRLYDGMTLDKVYPVARPFQRKGPVEGSAGGCAGGDREGGECEAVGGLAAAVRAGWRTAAACWPVAGTQPMLWTHCGPRCRGHRFTFSLPMETAD